MNNRAGAARPDGQRLYSGSPLLLTGGTSERKLEQFSRGGFRDRERSVGVISCGLKVRHVRGVDVIIQADDIDGNTTVPVAVQLRRQ